MADNLDMNTGSYASFNTYGATYEAERNKRVANVQDRLQLLLSVKSSMWVGSISRFLYFWVVDVFSFCSPELEPWHVVNGRAHSPTCPFSSKP